MVYEMIRRRGRAPAHLWIIAMDDIDRHRQLAADLHNISSKATIYDQVRELRRHMAHIRQLIG